MHTKESLIQDLRNMGIQETDTVFVHSSFKKIAGDEGVEGGAETIVDAFIEYLGPKGLAVFPAMSWKLGYYVNDRDETRIPELGPADGYRFYGNAFDVRETPCHGLGIIPELFRKRPGAVRSLCPTSSVAAFGQDAEEFCAGHELAETPMNWNSPWGKLYTRNAKILFLGTTICCNTFLHVIEEHAKVPGILAPYIWKYTVTDYAGNTYPVAFKRHEPGHNHYYIKMENEFLEQGISQKAVFGSADTRILDAVKETDYMVKRLQEEPTLFMHEYNPH